MPHRDIVAIGGSAGSMESLQKAVKFLPADLPAAIFVVLHIPTHQDSFLPQILGRAGILPATQAVDRQNFQTGHIYVAPPDHHLIIAESHIHLTRGPKEGLHRPCINVTFRSAADAYGPRVISGMLDDGASGLWEIVHRGGVSVIQDPQEARFPSMPMAALTDVPINFKLKSEEIGTYLADLVAGYEVPPVTRRMYVNDISPSNFSGFTCPECRGPLFEKHTDPVQYECRVGHVFSLESLVEESASTQERKMYEALVAVEEGVDLAERAAKRIKNGAKKNLSAEAERLRQHASTIRKLIEECRPATVEEKQDHVA